MLWFAWRGMAITEQEFPDVVLRGESSGTVFVVPFKINVCIFLPLIVGSDRVVFLQCGEEMLCVMFADIFDAKIIDSYTEHDRAPFVNPNAGGGGGFILSFVSEALAEEVVGKFTGLGYSVDTFADAKLYPTITCIDSEFIFSYELLWDVLEVYARILGAIEECA